MKYWFVIFLLTGFIALWCFGKWGRDLYVYLHLNAKAKVHIDHWSIKEISEGQYVFVAHYFFTVGGKKYGREHVFKTPVYLNEFAAQEALTQLKEKVWTVWYNKANPSISSLQKMYPFKTTIHCILACGVFLYFFYLRQYVLRNYA